MPQTQDPMLNRQALHALEERLLGFVIEPGGSLYSEARRVWNGVIDRHPALIVRCRGTSDVVEAVRFAREQDLPITVRGGGHNVAGNAVRDGAVVIDLSEMRGVFVDPHGQTVRVQGGARLKDVDRETQLHGLATPLGLMSATGVAGFTLSGGMAHLRRQYGLSCDNLLSAEVVTADGTVLTASEEENADLLWALRGGGGRFGGVTSFEYRLHPVGPQMNTLFVWYDAADGRRVFEQLRDVFEQAPDALSLMAFFAFVPAAEEFPEALWGQPSVVVLGAHAEGAALDGPVMGPLRELAEPNLDMSMTIPYTTLQSFLDADYPNGRRYYWKSIYLNELDAAAIDLVLRTGAESPSPLSTVDVWHLGGAIASVEPEATAYWHRDKTYLLTFEANWEEPERDDENIAWVREGIAAARTLPGAGGGYGNFPGFFEDPLRATFGGNYERLCTVKAAYDPTSVFGDDFTERSERS